MGAEVALALVLCDRLPVFIHVAPTGVAGGKQCPSPAAPKRVVCVVPSLTVPLWFSALLYSTGGTAKQPTPSTPAAPNPKPCPGLETVQAHRESVSYGRRTAAQQKGSGSSAAKPFGMFWSLRWSPYPIYCYCPPRHSELCCLREPMQSQMSL